MTRKLYTKIVAALAAAWFAGAALTACAADSGSETRPGLDPTVSAGFDAHRDYIKRGCGIPTDQQAAAYAAAKRVSPRVFVADRLNDTMCAPVPSTVPQLPTTGHPATFNDHARLDTAQVGVAP